MGQLPNDVIIKLGRQLVYKALVGQEDIDGDDFGDIFAAAVGGRHRAAPIGLADVTRARCAWSVKTVKGNPSNRGRAIRIISGRNSPDYSAGIENPHEDPELTGQAVLEIWNARVNDALSEFNELRVVVLVRDFPKRHFLIFEEDAQRYNHANYTWAFNNNGNLEGRSREANRSIRFVWQPHGSQFTIIRSVPQSAIRFSVNHEIPPVNPETVLESIGFTADWITNHGQG